MLVRLEVSFKQIMGKMRRIINIFAVNYAENENLHTR